MITFVEDWTAFVLFSPKYKAPYQTVLGLQDRATTPVLVKGRMFSTQHWRVVL